VIEILLLLFGVLLEATVEGLRRKPYKGVNLAAVISTVRFRLMILEKGFRYELRDRLHNLKDFVRDFPAILGYVIEKITRITHMSLP
jgi:hypothetical protein